MITAREIAREIENGTRPNQHIGKKTKEVLLQEIFSLKNRYKPNFMSESELTQWQKECDATIEAISQLPPEQQSKLFDKVDQMLKLS